MQIVYIHRNDFFRRPPVISVVEMLIQRGVKPYIITTGLNEYHKENLIKHNVLFSVVPFHLTSNIIFNYLNSKIWVRQVKKIVKQLAKKDKIILWIEGNYTMASLGADFINSYLHVLQVQELFDDRLLKGRIYKNCQKKIMPHSILNIVPEYNRAYILTAIFRLNHIPYILPNKPNSLPSESFFNSVKPRYRDLLRRIGKRKVILYQGIMSRERNLDNFVKACALLPSTEFVTIMLGGKENEIGDYKKYNSDLIHLPFVPSPEHLYITSLAYIGIVTYEHSSLNLIYCAPNKIFEYGAYGVPMICNDIPGLRTSIVQSGGGVACNADDVDDILIKLKTIINNHNEMATKARNYYDSVDNNVVMDEVLKQIDIYSSRVVCNF